MANIRHNTSYGVGTPGEPDFYPGCCEWCADNQQGNAIKYPPVGCDDSMCSNPAICPNYKGQYGQISSKPVLSPYPMQGPEEWSNIEGEEWGNTGIECDEILGGCPSNVAIGQIPAPKTDYKKGDIISKQFSNTCGPFPDTGNCVSGITLFQGTITGQVQLGKLAPKQYEVEWSTYPDGRKRIPVSTFVLPHNIFPVSILDEDGNVIDEEIKNIEIIEEENAVMTAGFGDNKIMLFGIAFVGAYLLFSSNKEK
jgi:hypothetical protein